MTHTKESLIAFTDKVRAAFLDRKIRSPIHLPGGNEDQLLAIFQSVKPQDWVFSTWRSMYHALLKGIPEQWVYEAVLAGRSMYLMSREHRFFCSSIVGGILPIALGVAAGIKKQGGKEQVWTCVGDMCARTGLFHEFLQYADGHQLPVKVVVEDNGVSTDTPTATVWGSDVEVRATHVPVIRYQYLRTNPHVGCGRHVTF